MTSHGEGNGLFGELQTGSMSSASHTNTSLTILNGDRIWPVTPFCSSLGPPAPPNKGSCPMLYLTNACILESICYTLVYGRGRLGFQQGLESEHLPRT